MNFNNKLNLCFEICPNTKPEKVINNLRTDQQKSHRMKSHLNSLVKHLSNYSATLEKTSILIDKPWALIDGEFEIQKIIFKKDKELILSKNGQVQIGKWDYFPEAKSLLIDRINDKILCNEAFIDNGVMILRLDGTDSRFFIFANENVVPDLDANRYLKRLRYQKLKIAETKLIDGRILEVQKREEWQEPQIGNPVTQEAEPIEDGKYQLANQREYFEVKKGRIFKILTETKYTNPSGQEVTIQQQDNWRIKHGDYVFMYGNQVEDSIVDFTNSKNLVIKDGIVIRLEHKNKILRWFSKTWKSFWGYYEE
jgi:mRNA-degrading endonuclease RelE of RelBE toxin-antitoxin system